MRRWISWIAMFLCFVGLTGCSLPRVTAEDRLFLPLSVELLGSYTLTDKKFKDTTVGGLSAITYDRKKDLYYTISDDRSDRNPARFYTLKIQTDQNAIKSVEVQNVTTLTDETGQAFAKGTIDAEGIALSPLNSVFISSEGVVKDGIPPFIGEFDLQTGQLKRKLMLPESYLPDATGVTQTRGIQDNRGFESLTLNAGASTAPAAEPFRLFSVVESPLVQDLELPKTKESLLNRFLHYQVIGERSTLISEHAYPLDPKPTGAIDHGLSELLSIDQGGHFLSLERSFGLTGFRIKLFQVETGTASDTSMIETLRGAKVQPARKELLLDLNQLGIRLDNLEGMTIGARLPDGTHTLVLVSDDNFNNLGQITQFLLFRLKGLKG
jgi:hypothetical protein